MDLLLLAVTALGCIGVFLMLPRERATLVRVGGLIGVMALAGLFLLLIRQGAATARPSDLLNTNTKLFTLREGNGVRVAAAGNADFSVIGSKGTFEVSLYGAATLGDVLKVINGAPGNHSVTASISPDRHHLMLTDSGASLRIEPRSFSDALADLGLTTRADGGTLTSLPVEFSATSAGPTLLFYVFAGIMVMGSVGVVTHPKPVYAALYFVLVTLAGAALFVLLMAEFMAIVLIIVYAGAILVTYVFVLMLASQGSTSNEPPEYDRRAAEPFIAVLVSFVLLGTVLQVLYPTGQAANRPVAISLEHKEDQRSESLGLAQGNGDQMMMDSQSTANAEHGKTTPGNMQLLGVTLYGHYAFSLELAGVLLTIALVGAVVIARKNVDYAGKAAGTGALPAE